MMMREFVRSSLRTFSIYLPSVPTLVADPDEDVEVLEDDFEVERRREERRLELDFELEESLDELSVP